MSLSNLVKSTSLVRVSKLSAFCSSDPAWATLWSWIWRIGVCFPSNRSICVLAPVSMVGVVAVGILFSDLFNRQGMEAAQRQFKIIASLTLWLKLDLGTFLLGRDFVPLRQSPSQIPCSSQWGISVTPSLGISTDNR